MNQLFSFTSTCPKCKRKRVIDMYHRGEILRLFELGYPIEGRCTKCNVRWPIGPEARARLSRALAASFSASLGQALRQRSDLL